MAKRLLVALGLPVLFLLFGPQATADGGVSPKEAARLIKKTKDLQIIDVRTPAEYADGHLARAKLIPVEEIAERLSEIDKKKPVLLYCRFGLKSRNALAVLQDHGFTNARQMEGGILAWQAAGLPVTQ
jgi:rhodanese-related sulfurtransferase